MVCDLLDFQQHVTTLLEAIEEIEEYFWSEATSSDDVYRFTRGGLMAT